MKRISIWEDTAQKGATYRKFSGNITADAVVIGGGITGLTTAMRLSDAGLKVIVLEARNLGLGTTGNSTGNLYVTVDEHLSTIKKKWGADTMKAIVSSRKEALDLIEDTVRRFSINCDFKRTSFNYFAETDGKESTKFIDAEYEALREAGVQVERSEGSVLPFTVKKTLTAHGQAQFHPLNYILGLAQGLSARCEIYENSQVIDFNDKEGTVKTDAGTIKAKHVIMATHVPIGNYMVQAFLGPYREHGVVAELSAGFCPDGIFWGIEQPKHSVRSFRKGEKNYVMVIGDKYKTGQGEDTEEYVKKLADYLQKRFNVAAITHTWGGQQYRPADGLPYIGKHGERSYFLTGFSTDGLVYGTLGAMIVADEIQEKKNPWKETYKLSRFDPVKSFKEFFRENTDVAGQYLKDVPWNADSWKDLQRGEGRVIKMGGEKMAVFRDDAGKDHVCSAVCTHMRCVVNWNPAEKTWDCPCHGSRFDTEGKVIEGPAISPLPKKHDG
jgi:glycine/D-amino acid oxidase-like deaminating enzyme/nitrite reductase/ring-hydroxylating ferredoxin subunit